MMKYLAQKFNTLVKRLDLTLEQVSAGTTQHGSRISFTSLRNLSHGTGGTNPSGTRIFALAQTLHVPVRFLVDDGAETPYTAVLADARLLSPTDRNNLIKDISEL